MELNYVPSSSQPHQQKNIALIMKEENHENQNVIGEVIGQTVIGAERGIEFPISADDVNSNVTNDKTHEDQSDCGEDHENHHADEEYSLGENQHDEGEHQDPETDHSNFETHTTHDAKVYVVTSLEDDDDRHVINKSNNEGEQPRRGLFGPPSWKPEQLQLAMEAVKKGYSLTEAGKLYGIPRTTLSNKIHGRKRKRPKPDMKDAIHSPNMSPYSYVQHGSNTTESHTLKISPNIENAIAIFISKQMPLQPHVFTRCVFDLIRYFGKSKLQLTYSDEYIKNWIRYFFLRHPKARFDVSILQNDSVQHEEEERHFVDYVLQRYQNKEKMDIVKSKLFDIVNEAHSSKTVNTLWWYYFLQKHDSVKNVFLNSMQWPETILDGTLLHGDSDRSMKVALTNMLLKADHIISPMQESRLEELRSNSSMDSNNAIYYQKPKHVSSQNKISSRTYIPMRPRSEYSINRQEDLSSGNDEMMDSLNETPDVKSSSNPSAKSFSTPSAKSLKETLASEGLRAVERKLSTEELQYFKFRYSNPHLEEGYEVWRNLRSACSGTFTKTT